MAGLKEIRKRIQSVKNTQKITRAMKMVAASKLRKAQTAMLNIRRYSDEMRHLAGVLADKVDCTHPLMIPHKKVGTEALIVVSGDRGLCGSFNANVSRHARRKADALQKEGVRPVLFFIGRKGAETLRNHAADQDIRFVGLLGDLSFDAMYDVVDFLAQGYLSGDYDRVTVVFNRFKSAVAQEVAEEQLFPITENIFEKHEIVRDGAERDIVFEPSAAALADYVVPRFAATELYHDLMESAASELSARMNSMEAATKNAAEMIGRLVISYNKERQNAITTELMEIVGGAEALKG